VSLFAILAIALAIRVMALGYSGRQLMFDEGYYIPAVHNILRLEPMPADPYRYAREGIDPNIEHPIGAKRIIAASVLLVGDNPYGWRLPGAIFGTLAILFVFLLARRLTGSDAAGLAAAGLVALDPMMLVHSRVAMLDIFVVTFTLAGLYSYVAGRPVAAGLLVAAAVCCKLTGLAGLVVIAIFELGRTWIDRARAKAPGPKGPGHQGPGLHKLLWMAVTTVLAVPALLWVLNRGASVFANPIDNLFYVYTHQAATYGFRPPGPIPQSRPWEWLLNRQEINYFQQGVLHLRGLYNPLLIFATVPLTLWSVFQFVRRRSESALMVLAMIGGCFLPLVIASLQTPRQTYLYYFLPTLPALAIGVGVFGASVRLPRAITTAYLVAAAAAFVYYFPFRGLP
jgi:dolichyl-phosphate-mannose-protein mannosyltransferase